MARVELAGASNPLTFAQEMRASLTRLNFPLEAHPHARKALGISEESPVSMIATYQIALGEIREEASLTEEIAPIGILLQRFMIGEQMYSVQDMLAYVPWSIGTQIPGAGQMGVYHVTTAQDGQDYTSFMAIRDYSKGEEEWVVSVEEVAESEEALRAKLAERDDLMLPSRQLRDYVAGISEEATDTRLVA